MLAVLSSLFQAHQATFWSLIGSYISGGLLAIALDSYFYSSQKKYRDWLMPLWFQLSDHTAVNVNLRVVEHLGQFDRWVFGPKLISLRMLVIGLAVAAVVQAIFFGSTMDLSSPAKLGNTAVAFVFFVGIPFMIALIVTRWCVHLADSGRSMPSTLAAISALLLFQFLATALLMLATAFIYMGIIESAGRDHLTDYEMIDLVALEGVLAAVFILTTFEITFVPIFCYLAIAAFTILLVVLINVFRGSLERELDENVRKVWQFAFRMAWVLGGILLIAGFFAYSAVLHGFDLGRRVLPFHLGSAMASDYLQSLPAADRPAAARQIQHDTTLMPTTDPKRLLEDSRTGIFVVARMMAGDLSAKTDPVKQYFDQTNSCWMSLNYDQLQEMIKARLDAEPNDIWGLYQEATYYTFADHKPQLATTYGAAFDHQVAVSQASQLVKDQAHKLFENIQLLARIPDMSAYATPDRLHQMLQNFPGNDKGRDIWLACRHQP